MGNASRHLCGLLLVPAVWAALCLTAPAQMIGNGNNIGNFPGMLPGQTGGMMPGQAGGMMPGQAGGMMPGQAGGMNSIGNQIGLTPQMQQYMMLRSLQGIGHRHGVQTGVANPIMGAGPQFDPSAAWGYDNSAAQDNSGRRSTSEKRAAVRQAREQQKQLARERADSKKAKAPTKQVGKPKFNAS